MPVDLSMIGLEGQQAYYNRMQTAAQTALTQSETQRIQLENQQTQRMNDLNQQASAQLNALVQGKAGADQPDPSQIAQHMTSMADPLRMVGDIYMKGGAIKAGSDMYKSAADIQQKEAQITKEHADTQKARLENIQKGSAIVAQEIGNAKNASEWQIGLNNIQAAMQRGDFVMEPELFDQLKNMPYDPNAAAYFRQKAISAGDQARMELQQNHNQVTETIQAGNAATRRAQVQVARARQAETERHNRVMEKARGSGGDDKPLAAPNAAAMQTVYSVLKSEAYSGVNTGTKANPDPQFAAAAQYVAGQAQQLIRQNRGMDYPTAVQRVVMQGKAVGMFSTKKGDSGIFGFGGSPDTPQFTHPDKGKTPQTAIPVPDDVKQMQVGKYYSTARGLAQWNGQAFIPVK